MRPNPKKLNQLQLKTLAILQAMARDERLANSPDADGTVLIHSLPHAHGDHFHVGSLMVSARDATGLANPNVISALIRKGLMLTGAAGVPVLTADGRGYDTGIADQILHEPG
jgi:hypothetical protein